MKTYKRHLLKKGSTIREALKRLDLLAKDAIIFIVSDNDKLVGSLTDGDVRRGLLKGYTIDNKVDEIIQQSPRFIRKGERDIAKVIEYRDNNFRIIPILDSENHVVNVINFGVIRSYLPVDSVIMAGGRGERLRPLTDTIPKPMLKVGNKPILEYNLDRLSLYGIDDFWISLKYLGKQVKDYFGNGSERNIDIKYVYENESMGTIGSVSMINDFIHNFVLVTNSDLLTNIDYEHFFLDFIRQDADLAVVTIPYKVNIPYAVLETNNGHVISLREKPSFTYYSNGGIYLMKRKITEIIPSDVKFDAVDLIEKLIQDGFRVISYPLNAYWLDIGSHEDYEKAQTDIKNIKF